MKQISQSHAGSRFQKPVLTLLAAALFLLGGCSSPAEKASRYYENGMVLLEKGELEKARLEFQNAIQLVNTMSDAVYGMAMIAERQSDWERMYGLLNRVVDMNPKHVQAHIRIGRLLLASGQMDGALKSCDAALALAADDLDALSLRAAILYKLGDTAGALEQARKVLSKDPVRTEALVVMASERMTANDVKGAIAYLDKGIAGDGKNVSLKLIKIQALETSGDINGAEALYENLIASTQNPQKGGLRQALSQFHLRHGKAEKAEEQLRAIASENPSDLKAKLTVVRFIKAAKGDDAAISELQAFIAREPANYDLRFALADLHRYRKDSAAMTTILNDIAQKAGVKDALKAKSWLAASMLENGKRDEAAKLVSTILTEDPRHEEAMLLKTSMAIDERRIEPAIADLRTLLREVPDSPRAHLLLGHAHELAGSAELAEGEYLRAFQTGKQTEAFGLPYAEFLIRRGDAARAIRVVDDLLRVFPESLPALQLLAKARITQGDWIGAQEVADKITRLGNQEHISEQIRGTVYARMHNYDASIKAFKSAYSASPQEVRPMIALVRTYMAAGKKKEAMNFVDSILSANQGNAIALALKSQLLLADNDIPGAQKALESAVSAAPDSDEGYRNLASLHVREKRYDDAIAVIERGLKTLPDNFNLQLSLASIYELSGRADAAIALYERMLTRHPNADILVNNLVSLLSESRKDQESLKRAYDIAKRLERSDIPHFKDTWAWVSYRTGRHQQAASALEAATRQMPEMPVFRYHLGLVYSALGNKQEARNQLEKALKLAEKAPFEQVEQARKTLAEL